MKKEIELRNEIKELRGKLQHAELMRAFSPEIMECGENRDWELIKKHGEPRELTGNYTVILLKK